MSNRDPRIDAYIARAPAFARPVLEHLRAIVHEGCPHVQETIKWGRPSFEHHGILADMGAFKAHATFGFRNGRLLVGAAGRPAESAMGQFGRIRELRDLPARRVLIGYVRRAAKLNEQGVKPLARRVRAARPEATPSPAFAAALARNRRARAAFDAASPGQRREYVEWIDAARRDETRARRIATAVAQLAEGRTLHWRYRRPAAKRTARAGAKPATKAARRVQTAGTRTRSARGRTR